jgi:hypothetical protein
VDQGRLRIVSDRDQGTHGDGAVGGVEMDIHVEGDEGDGLALVVRGDGRWGQLLRG